MQDFRELKVWQKAHQIALRVYEVSKGFPKDERYGLTAQIRRAVVSIAANIVEGRGSGGDATFCRHLRISMGSAFEVEYFLLLASDLGYLDRKLCDELSQMVTEVRRMLNALMQSLSTAK